MSFSQNNEERLILDYFKGRTGTFLDIGANDGVTVSNTRALALNGWSGVLVDASPLAFAKLQALYGDNPNMELFNVAIFNDDGKVAFHESGTHFGKDDVALLSSIYPSETEKWRSTTEFTNTMVDCLSVASLLSKCKARNFEFITIDIEGADLVALQQLDLTALRCEMLIVEVNDNPVEPFTEHCAKHGLRFVTRNAENAIYQR